MNWVLCSGGVLAGASNKRVRKKPARGQQEASKRPASGQEEAPHGEDLLKHRNH